ncbi:unnamed protein product [Rotaria magnacalcarata]
MSKSKVNDAKLRLVQTSLKDLSTIEEYQHLAWKNLKTIINGCLHKGNTSNLPLVISELFQYNIVRGRGFPGRTFRSPDTVETGRKDAEESPCSVGKHGKSLEHGSSIPVGKISEFFPMIYC